MTAENQAIPAVTVERGPQDWQIVQQGVQGSARIALEGHWWTICSRKSPEVRIRVVREGTCSAITRRHDWIPAETTIDRSKTGEDAGKCGTWRLDLAPIPAGGPYRIETSIGSAEDAIEWRRGGQVIHFLGVGDLWLIAGQSNAEGYGRDPVEDPSEIGVHQLGADNRWQLAAHSSLHHPWLAFAKIVKRELGYPVGLIATAVGGSPVSRWDPGQNGDLYDKMAARVALAGGTVRGCLWYQGESDTAAEAYPQYKSCFTRFLAGLRDLVKRNDLPIITVQLNRLLSGDNGAGWEAMREIQRQLSHDLPGVFLISVFESVLCDGIHNGSPGNLLIGKRAADTALGGVYGRELYFRHPECVKAEAVDARTIDLHFDNVVTRLDYSCAVNHGFAFAVRDKLGEVPVAGYDMPCSTTLRIELDRELTGEATVTGAPGSCPPHVVPRDINGYRGMLGFTCAVTRS